MQSSSPHRIALVGCGAMSGCWLNAWKAHRDQFGEIVALLDINPEAATRRAAEFELNGVWTGNSLEQMLQATSPTVLFDVTIPEAHFPITKAALESGCHVLGEKPLAANTAEAAALVGLARRTERVFAVIQNRRYLPGIRKVCEVLASGIIGAPHTFTVEFFIGAHFGGFRDVMKHPLLLDMAIHTFDAARMLSGRKAEWVFCHEFNPNGSWYAHGASAHAVFGLEDGGTFTYTGSWAAIGHQTDWAGSWRIVGPLGTLRWNGADQIVVERRAGEHQPGKFIDECETLTFTPEPENGAPTGHEANMLDFFNAIQNGGRPGTCASDNIHSLAMVESAIRSAEKGCREPVQIFA